MQDDIIISSSRTHLGFTVTVLHKPTGVEVTVKSPSFTKAREEAIKLLLGEIS